MLSRAPFSAPVFDDQIDLTALKCNNMAYFDDSIGIISSFTPPKQYSTAAKGSWAALNGNWRDESGAIHFSHWQQIPQLG